MLGFEEDASLCIEEMIEDIEYSSHNTVSVNVVGHEYLEEFPTYQNADAMLLDGTYSNRFDEETWLDIYQDGWFEIWDDERVQNIEDYSFDYEYLIDKFDLVDRKNDDEFDMVWLVNIDPINDYESVMVGKNAYWINGEPQYANCDNFAIINVSISRRDSNFHCMGHLVENLLNNVFESDEDSFYPINGRGRSGTVNYEDLSLWEKFTLNRAAYAEEQEFYGVGNEHFPANAESDYDYSNKDYVLSTWKDWVNNYPNLTNETTRINSTAWTSGNSMAADRAYTRWFFYAMPHVEGLNEEGYSNNWWKYIVSLDYVEKVETVGNSKISLDLIDGSQKLKFKLKYASGAQKEISLNSDLAIFEIENEKIASINSKGYLDLNDVGKTTLWCYVDGRKASYQITVRDVEEVEEEDKKNESKKDDEKEEKNTNGVKDDKEKEENTKTEDVVQHENWVNTFVDVEKNSWYYEYVKFVNQNALFQGVTPTEFAPDNNLTRGMIVMVLYRLDKARETEKATFTDVPRDAYYSEAIAWASKNNLVTGVGDGLFEPDRNITREELATIIYRYASAKGKGFVGYWMLQINYWDTEDISDYAFEPICWCSANGILNGKDNNAIDPSGLATRAEAAAIVQRLFNLLNQ
ncbi:MAG: S-layer homology domain-containing protein [Clostridia bacterium]|nr:S-layer homology domain-containing protein [Clostridia bacterium]